MEHVKDTFIAFLVALVVWKAKAIGLPIDEQGASQLIGLLVIWILGKLQASPLAPKDPAPPTTPPKAD